MTQRTAAEDELNGAQLPQLFFPVSTAGQAVTEALPHDLAGVLLN